MIKLYRILLLFFLTLYSTSLSFALETDTHEQLNEFVAINNLNGISLDFYLRNQLGFQKGVNEEFESINANTVYEWIRSGGLKEDKPYWFTPYIRSVNHFHNPLTDLGYSGFWGTGVMSGMSSIQWALLPQDEQSILCWLGCYSWADVRYYYYTALTASNKGNRDTYFTETFRGVGQLMHLVHDASVPSHTRDDGHAIYNYEKWVKEEADISTYNPVFFSGANDINSLIDTNQYNAPNPDPNIAVGTDIGLSEYTNANFFSDDTINSTNFTYPQITQQTPIVSRTFINSLWDTEYERQYYLKDCCGETKGGEGYLLAAVDFLDYYRNEYPALSFALPRIPVLDSNVYRDYADLLIPRAVGYSAGLLNYFFRGQLEPINLLETLNQYDEVTDITMKIKNDTPNESLEPGTNPISKFIVSYEYKISGNYYYGTSTEIVLNEIITSGSISTSDYIFNFSTPIPSNAENLRYWLVYRGKLGNEDDAVVGRIVPRVFVVINPGDPVTRASLGKQYYYRKANIMSPVIEADLPFNLIDDGGYWNSATSDWTYSADPNSLLIPLSVGGPQYIAKYKDDISNTVRFVPNVSYEKNAYQDFHKIYTISSQVAKDFYYVIFEGTPLLSSGKYEENLGYMEYMEDPNSPGTYGIYSLSPLVASYPTQRYFSSYNSMNFIGTFLEYDSARFHRFDMTIDVQTVPVDAEAPITSVVAVTNTGSGFDVETPSIFNYTRPNPYWGGSTGYGSSGTDNYTADIGSSMSYISSYDKCVTEDNDCGNVNQGTSSVNTVYDIPYNFNSYVRVHNNDGGQYYEELYINGVNRETSLISTDKLETHYQILAVYKDIAVIRKTNWTSRTETALPYRYKMILADDLSMINPQLYEIAQNHTVTYYIYINGNRYDLTGQTTVQSKVLDYPYHADFNDHMNGLPDIEYLTFEYVEDITGYHLDRIFISDTFDGNYILIAFDEYDYNSGAGLVHDLNYEESDTGNGKYFLFFDIPPGEIQGASHEALPVGRQLLLFRSDGTLEDSLQDPIGLNYFIGSIGILN